MSLGFIIYQQLLSLKYILIKIINLIFRVYFTTCRAIAYNDTKFNEWVAEGKAPPVSGIRRLYWTVQSLGFKTVFLSGTAEKFTDVRISNLHESGYYNWEKLILKYDI